MEKEVYGRNELAIYFEKRRDFFIKLTFYLLYQLERGSFMESQRSKENEKEGDAEAEILRTIEDIRKNIMNNVREYRRQSNMSQNELAALIGIHRSYLSEMENGVRLPSIKVIVRIADVFQIEPWELLCAAKEEKH